MLLVLIIFNLLLAAFNLHSFVLVNFVILNLLLLLQDPDLVSQQVEVLLLDDLAELLFREWELLRMLVILLLQILQQHLLLIGVKLIQIDHHVVFLVILFLDFNAVLFLLFIFVLLDFKFLVRSIFDIIVAFL